ncbi:MerR family DNA-binding transcriptional regulator [Streptomyces sp. NPDC018019]|uniref:MerR family DNA-binding transcriptional regulator n=1 Tax=Streptomyces sp. NPDC018019 TaxID=3365030 RepID=UPI0037904FD4
MHVRHAATLPQGKGQVGRWPGAHHRAAGRYVGVSIQTVRVYHDKGPLPEPDRDVSGYRRYADHAINCPS